MQPVLTKLSLDHFARILGIPPMHFWGVNISEMQQGNCGQAWFQHAWQDSDRVSRDDIAYAIAEAEREIEQVIGYRLLPSWEEDEWQPTIQPFRRDTYNLNGHDLRGRGQLVFGRWGYLLTGGIRSVSTVEAGATVTYDNDGVMQPATWKNRATVTVTVADEVPDDEIAVYYPGHAGDDRWRIRPLTVSHALGTYTITFARELALIPDYFDSYDPQTLRAADGTIDANFLDTVDVCRVYNDPQQQATLLWEGGGCSCSSGSCSYGTQTACLLLRDNPRLSAMVWTPGSWDADEQVFNVEPFAACRHPDLVRLWYYAGWRDKNSDHPLIEMDDQWARIVAHFAASKLGRPPCACVAGQFEQWQADLAFAGGANETGIYNLSPSDLGNPFGTRRGAVAAWRFARVPGVAIGQVALDR